MKFKSGDLVMLINTLGVPTARLKGLAPGHVGEIERFCAVCSWRAALARNSDQLYYHVTFSSGRFGCPENVLKKLGDDPDAQTVKIEEEVAA